MAFLDRIDECNAHDLSRYVPLFVGGAEPVGWVRRDRLAILQLVAPPEDGWVVATDQIALEVDGAAAATAVFEKVVAGLVARGELRPPISELYAVGLMFGDAPRALIDRVAVSWFGVRAFGVHLNGFVCGGDRPDDLRVWVATRSREKATFPGMLDNMVAGGQSHGITLLDNVVKECGEEAGIPSELARGAEACGLVRYTAEQDVGLKPDTMFCFDLELPADFVPRPVDGEVESFDLVPVRDVATIVRDTQQFKFNCNLVILDFLLRRGILDSRDPEYAAVMTRLRAPHPASLLSGLPPAGSP